MLVDMLLQIFRPFHASLHTWVPHCRPSALHFSLQASGLNQAALRDSRMIGFVRVCALSAEYDFMRPPQHKTAEAVAFISNCGAQSFRLDAVRQLSQVPTVV